MGHDPKAVPTIMGSYDFKSELDNIRRTSSGIAMLKAIDDSPKEFFLIAFPDGSSEKTGPYIFVNPKPCTPVQTNRGWKTPTSTRALTHELGHAAQEIMEIYPSAFPTERSFEMDNIRRFENPVNYPLDGLIRTRWGNVGD